MTPKNIFWLDVIEFIYHNYHANKYITYNTGPDMFTAFLKLNQHKYDNIYFEEDLLSRYNNGVVKHIKTGLWREKKFFNLSKKCIICQNQPFICNCYNHKWYQIDFILYYNWKIIIIFCILLSNIIFIYIYIYNNEI